MSYLYSVLCLAVQPGGWTYFPARCARGRGHEGDHKSASYQDYEVSTWARSEEEDDD